MNASINIFNKKIINGEIVGDIMAESSNLVSTEVDSNLAPRLIDEFPILFVAASYASGKSTFKGLEELKFKESDRLETMAIALKDAGVELEQKKILSKLRVTKNNEEVIMLLQKVIIE